jgi:hypothetical protein
MGYPQMGTGPALVLGTPASGQFSFLIERAMDQIYPEAEDRVREILAELDCVEAQISDAKSRLKVTRAENVYLRASEEITDLEDLYVYWVTGLEDIFGIPCNPFSRRMSRIGYGTLRVEEPF